MLVLNPTTLSLEDDNIDTFSETISKSSKIDVFSDNLLKELFKLFIEKKKYDSNCEQINSDLEKSFKSQEIFLNKVNLKENLINIGFSEIIDRFGNCYDITKEASENKIFDFYKSKGYTNDFSSKSLVLSAPYSIFLEYLESIGAKLGILWTNRNHDDIIPIRFLFYFGGPILFNYWQIIYRCYNGALIRSDIVKKASKVFHAHKTWEDVFCLRSETIKYYGFGFCKEPEAVTKNKIYFSFDRVENNENLDQNFIKDNDLYNFDNYIKILKNDIFPLIKESERLLEFRI